VPGIYKIPLTKQDQEYRAKKRAERAAAASENPK